MDSTQRTRPRTGGSPVGLVIFIILTVVFAVLAYLAFAKYQTSQQTVATLEGEIAGAKAAETRLLATEKAFREVTGAATPDALRTDIASAFDATAALNIGNEQERTAAMALRGAYQAIGVLRSTQEGLMAQLATQEASIKSLTEQKKESEAVYQADLAARGAEIVAMRRAAESEKQSLLARLDEEVIARSTLRDQYYTERDAWTRENTRQTFHIEELKNRVRELSGDGEYIIERADATITRIDMKERLVTLDKGANEGMRKQMRFVAFTTDPRGRPVRKGVVEIVTVDPTVSVARILSEQPNMAVGRGDSVYNLAGPDKKLFVFVGTPKLYTIQQWTNFIRTQGGDVVGEVQKGPQVADYLIWGEFDEQDPEAVRMIFDAREFGLKILKEAELQEWMAVK